MYENLLGCFLQIAPEIGMNDEYNFRCFCKITKSDNDLHHVSPSLRIQQQ